MHPGESLSTHANKAEICEVSFPHLDSTSSIVYICISDDLGNILNNLSKALATTPIPRGPGLISVHFMLARVF